MAEQQIKLTKTEFLDILNRARIKMARIEELNKHGLYVFDVINRTLLAVRDEILAS